MLTVFGGRTIEHVSKAANYTHNNMGFRNRLPSKCWSQVTKGSVMTESGFEEMKKMSHKCHTISAIFHKASCELSSSLSCSVDLPAIASKSCRGNVSFHVLQQSE
jgi:hypothetical protein